MAALKAFDDTVCLPVPDLCKSPKIGAASWQSGVSAKSADPEDAAKFIEFAQQDKHQADFSIGIGLIPAAPTAAATIDNFQVGGPLSVFVGLSNAQGMARPVTPGYVLQAKVFERAAADTANGAAVAATLDAAVDEINADVEKNGRCVAR